MTNGPRRADRPAWRKSSYSTGTGNCVEVAEGIDRVSVRHSKRPADGTITFSLPAWSAFVREARDGLPSAGSAATVANDGADTVVHSPATGVTLRFDADEWSAFVAGARNREFELPASLASAAG